MDKITLDYRTIQFEKVDIADKDYARTLKICNNGENTNFLDITENEYQLIKDIMLKNDNIKHYDCCNNQYHESYNY